jgi:PleD family two-component response regulator
MPHPLPVAPTPPPPIVLVEDDDDTVELYERYLNGSGYWVVTAQNSDEGCRVFDELQPDIVVTYSTCRVEAEVRSGSRIPLRERGTAINIFSPARKDAGGFFAIATAVATIDYHE